MAVLRSWLLALLVGVALISSAQAAKHKFKDGEKIILWANKGAGLLRLAPSSVCTLEQD